MDKKEIAKLAVETVKDFLILTNREPITSASVKTLENMIVTRLEINPGRITLENSSSPGCLECGSSFNDMHFTWCPALSRMLR